MRFTVKIAEYDDMQKTAQVESDTMGSYVYARTAWNYFMTSPGAFLCAYNEEGTMTGIAHLAVLPDGSGWFEDLRVHPDFQDMGVGKSLYEKAIELIRDQYHCPSLSMYTGERNVRSVGLADRYGLTEVHNFTEYDYSVTGHKDSHGFRYMDWERAESEVMPLAEEYGGYLSVNRTMYHFTADNIRWMADNGFFFEDEEGNIVGTGSRFQHGSKLFVLLAKGDAEKCLDFAVNLARAKNIPTVTCTFASCNGKLEKALQDYGFKLQGELITKERVFAAH